jgi:outer membrane receptor protein involved in Fe transport
MFNKFFALILLITTISVASAKNNVTIHGKVTEKENGKALPFATIVIHSTDNKIITGTTTGDDGSFKLNNGELTGEYKVKVSFIGFQDTTINLVLKEQASSVDLGIIQLKGMATSLGSAVVTARVPVIEQKLDKIVMNVAEAVATQGSNALDILKKAPGVSVDPSGNILLNGSAVQVWIDGRPSNFSGADLEALLSGTDGSTIDKIEIIAHPSSRYDAAGSGGIINIKTKKNFAKGLNGSARIGYSGSPYKNYYQSADGSLVLNYRTEKNNTSFSYSPRYNEGFNTFVTTTDMGGGNTAESDTYLNRTTDGHSFKLSNDFFANKKNIFGFVVGGTMRETNDSTLYPATSKLFRNGNLVEDSYADIKNRFGFNGLSANLNYTRIFKEGQEITLNADYFYYDLGNKSNQLNTYLNDAGQEIKDPLNFRINSSQFINIRSAKADYEQSIKKSGKIEAGVKWAMSTTDNNLLREEKNGPVWQPNTDQSTIFYYTENISAAYVSVANQFSSKFNVKGGLRAEWTHAKGEWITADTVTKKSYLDLFPTLFVGYNPNQKIRLGLSYTLRIQRPNFEQLNPQRFYIDVNTSALGNPNIEPQYGHQMSLSLGLGKHFNFGINSQLINKAIIQTPSLDTQTGEKLMTWDNFGKLNMTGINAAITELPVAKWFLLNGNVYMANVTTSLDEYSKSKVFAQGNFNSTFLLPKDTKIEFTGFFSSGVPYGYFDIKPRYEFSFGVKKGLFNNKGNLALLVTDIFGTNVNRVSLQDEIFKDYQFESKYKSQRATLTFSYRFGQGKAAKQRKVGNVDETSRVNSGN